MITKIYIAKDNGTEPIMMVRAFQWEGPLNPDQIPRWFIGMVIMGRARFPTRREGQDGQVILDTPKGTQIAGINDYIFQDFSGEIYTLEDSVFRKTFRIAPENKTNPPPTPRQLQ